MFSDDEEQEVIVNENVDTRTENEQLRASNFLRNHGVLTQLGLQPHALRSALQDHKKGLKKVRNEH